MRKKTYEIGGYSVFRSLLEAITSNGRVNKIKYQSFSNKIWLRLKYLSLLETSLIQYYKHGTKALLLRLFRENGQLIKCMVFFQAVSLFQTGHKWHKLRFVSYEDVYILKYLCHTPLILTKQAFDWASWGLDVFCAIPCGNHIYILNTNIDTRQQKKRDGKIQTMV